MLTRILILSAALGGLNPGLETAPTVGTPPVDEPFGVFVKLAENVNADFDRVLDKTRAALVESPWQVIAEREVAVDRSNCSYRSHLLILHSQSYAESLIGVNPEAPFALPVRMVVFEDENGVQIAVANPQSLNRTIVSETDYSAVAAGAVGELRALIAGAFPGNESAAQYGQVRDRGRISRTMGLIAGGAFPGKVETLYEESLEGETLAQFATRLYDGLGDVGGSWRWGIEPVYMLDMSDQGVVVIGVSGDEMEARSFQIVGNGSDDSRADFACAGIDHGPAYPIELVVTVEDDDVVIRAIDGMFRMKMYFEDAGNMKFAANMRMPGSIEDEIRDKVEEALLN